MFRLRWLWLSFEKKCHFKLLKKDLFFCSFFFFFWSWLVNSYDNWKSNVPLKLILLNTNSQLQLRISDLVFQPCPNLFQFTFGLLLVHFQSTSVALPVHFRVTSGSLKVHFLFTSWKYKVSQSGMYVFEIVGTTKLLDMRTCGVAMVFVYQTL